MVSARSDVNSRTVLFSMAFRGDQELLAEVKHINRHAAFLGGLRSPVHRRACDVYICLSWGLLYISDCCVTES